jgi:hypothetical protein
MISCEKEFTLAVAPGFYCVAILDLSWTVDNESGSAYSMSGGDGTFAIHRTNSGSDFDTLTSSTLLCLPPVFSQYPATIEIDWNYTLHATGGGNQSGFSVYARLNGNLLAPQKNASTPPDGETGSGTTTIATGMLSAGQSYTITIHFDSGITGTGSIDLIGAIRIRPLTPP